MENHVRKKIGFKKREEGGIGTVIRQLSSNSTKHVTMHVHILQFIMSFGMFLKLLKKEDEVDVTLLLPCRVDQLVQKYLTKKISSSGQTKIDELVLKKQQDAKNIYDLYIKKKLTCLIGPSL